jgi:hypothetical protein
VPDRSRQQSGRSRANALAAAATLLALVVLLTATVARPASWFTEPYPPAAAGAVARVAARNPEARIWSDRRTASASSSSTGRSAHARSAACSTSRGRGSSIPVTASPSSNDLCRCTRREGADRFEREPIVASPLDPRLFHR